MSNATLALIGLSLGTLALKAAVPLVLGGGRPLPPRLARGAALAPAALLAALTATGTFTHDSAFAVDARIVGVAVAAVALRARLPFVVVVVAASAATALARALGG